MLQARLGATIPRIAGSSFLLLVVCGLLFAIRIMASKAALGAGIQPFQLGVVGNLGAALVVLPWLYATRQPIPLGPRLLALYLLLGLLSVSVPTLLGYAIVERVGPAYAVTVYSLSPLLTMSIAAGFGIERLTARRSAGIAIGFLGMAALVRHQIAEIDLDRPAWVLLGLAIPACVAVGNIVRTAWWPRGTSAPAFSCGMLVASGLMTALASPAFEAPGDWRFAEPAIAAWLAGTIALAALSQMLNFRLQEVAGPVVFSQIGYWSTGFGTILAALLFGDLPSALSLAGLGGIILGGILASRRPPAAPPAPLPAGPDPAGGTAGGRHP